MNSDTRMRSQPAISLNQKNIISIPSNRLASSTTVFFEAALVAALVVRTQTDRGSMQSASPNANKGLLAKAQVAARRIPEPTQKSISQKQATVYQARPLGRSAVTTVASYRIVDQAVRSITKAKPKSQPKSFAEHELPGSKSPGISVAWYRFVLTQWLVYRSLQL